MYILLIRHAESVGNVLGLIQGQKDYPLSATGHQQAAQLHDYLQHHGWTPTHLYTSPLERARITADTCRGKHLCSITVSQSLQEIHAGILQGLTWEEAHSRYPDLCQTLESSLKWVAIPGAESPVEVFARAKRFLNDIVGRHQNCDRLWVFSHGGFLQYLVAAWLGCEHVWSLSIAPTALFEFEINLDFWQGEPCDRYMAHHFKILQFNAVPTSSSSSRI